MVTCDQSIFVGNKAKVRISKQVFQESKGRQSFRKTNISYLLIRTRACAYQRNKKCLLSGNFGVLGFRETPVLRFALLSYSRQYEPLFHIHLEVLPYEELKRQFLAVFTKCGVSEKKNMSRF